MKKRVLISVLTISVVMFAMLHLCCQLFDPPTAPEKTDVSVIFKASNGQIYKGSLIDSVGKEVEIGAALYLPDNFDSLSIKILDGSSTMMDTMFHSFKVGYFYDTIWVRNTFWTPGDKKVMITPFSRPERLPIVETITIQGVSQNTSPKWSVDTLKKTIKVGTQLFQALSEICSDAETNRLTYTLLPGLPDNDTVIKTTYQFTPILQDMGTQIVLVKASDPEGSFAVLPIKIAVDTSSEDNQPPEITTVTYQKGAGVTGSVPVDTNKYKAGEKVTVLGNSGNLAKNGFTFSGWNTKEDGSGASYSVGATFLMGSVNVILYAQWTTSPTFKIVYNGNGNTGGTVPIDSNSYTTTSMITVKENSSLLAKKGSTFAGWNSVSDGSGTTYAVGATFSMGNVNITLYAMWKSQSTFTVTYNGNTNTAGAAPVDPANYEPGTTVTVKGNNGNMVKTNFTFAGWNTAADGSGIAFAAGSTFALGTDVTLYAHWTQHPTFTITYNGNANTSGSVPVDAGNYETGMIVTVKDNTGNMVKTGSTFTGWNTAADGSGTAYAARVTFPMGSANVTLYAQWTTKPAFTVNYNGNGNTGGTVPTDANRYETAAAVTVKENTGLLVKTGAAFTGWNTAADGSGTVYATGVTFPMGITNVTLYAQWTLKPTFTVTYNGNGSTAGTVPIDTSKYETSVTVTLKGNTGSLFRNGFTFTGWNTAANGSGTTYAVGTTFQMSSADIKLFAQWAVDSLTVSFNTKGGSSVASQKVVYGSSATAPSTPPTRTGFTFGGWFKEETCTNPWNFTTEIITADVTIYSKWVVITCIVSFDSKGGSTMAPQAVDYGSFATAPSPAPNRSGYTFGGWYKEDACTTPWNFTTNAITANVTIYAKWTVITNTVVFNTQGGSAVASQTINYGGTVTAPTSNPDRTGYTFNGWFSDAAGTSPWNFATQTITAPTTIYAKWTINTYIVAFNTQGGSTVSSQSITYGGLVTKPVTPPSKTSYIFRGWFKEATGTNAWNFNNDAVTSDITIYAKWAIMDADSNIYTEVTIGNLVWMVENLKTTKYNDGTPIPLVTESSPWSGFSANEAYCWYNNDIANKNTYGALYGGGIIYHEKPLAPVGWHVPTIDEWNALINYLGDASTSGGKLKATTLWDAPNTGATNSSGFKALPGGRRSGDCQDIGKSGYWWTNTVGEIMSYVGCSMSSSSAAVNNIGGYLLSNGLSVRCVRD